VPLAHRKIQTIKFQGNNIIKPSYTLKS